MLYEDMGNTQTGDMGVTHVPGLYRVRGRKDARRGRGWQGPRQPWRTRAVRKEMGAIAASRGLFLHLGTLCAAVSRFIGRERVSRRPSRTLF